ncbi:RNase adapter RapZ [Desulforhabdus sp. TSK]|uniref:RNase adapter RapZ n=1 Tax=Desulforhabdus sp. TSK TaxID=2925014 RepID=UPI001FC835D4|nr:RNase adapter RapZ [Desulforhabdus sp. TSK]GKT08392.1 nucleotide-binding protein [Desulforhabdus sp. TSK]
MPQIKVHVVIVTGLSGSGKSTAIKAFEDLDYFCIDNLPVPMLPDFLSLCERDMPDISKIALGIDIRERKFLKDYETIFKKLEDSGYRFEMLFLEAATDILQRRYSQTRRVHPAGSSDSLLLDAIHNEREQLKALRNRATRIVDTGNLSVHQLKALITRSYSMVSDKEMLAVQVLSFGFKYGLPFEADVVMDVRFLPNPYFVEALREKDGCSTEISSWVLQWPAALRFIDAFSRLVLGILPAYVAEGKRYLTIAVGCTGGKHRSVVIANEIAAQLEKNDYFVNVFHRDIHLE